jgi:outer membrane protein OmpA-like peptidoglycan-associated protein
MRSAILLLCCLVTPAAAQVSTDTQALDHLAPATPATPAAPASGAADAAGTADQPAPRPHRIRHAPSAHKLVAPPMPATPPPNPVILPPPVVMPAHAPPPPPPMFVRADAPGVVSPIPHGFSISFGPGLFDLNAATNAALVNLAKQAVATPAMTIAVTAWAPGVADDPSTARRLSLDRALSARAVLIHGGVVSERIRVVAKGDHDVGPGGPDRVDVTSAVPAVAAAPVAAAPKP